ncbi:hypothetical protein [Chitinophaga sp. Cy-1792]|uniref:hypothetical protein n=1 Tax=Chitinophaga sp. Cy-1792 TaxID=2608339 RepID=UPI00141DE93B|nr:hypothetical protein [Chitinophaga sp. Cy-1792]NIG56218.1 hypothetical protein [Chitinophaga sp. Cy-1792]
MKVVARLVLLFILTTFLLPATRESGKVTLYPHAARYTTTTKLQQRFLLADPDQYQVKTTQERHKRRPVGLNDYINHACVVSVIHLKDRFIYVEQPSRGYLHNRYLSIHPPLRSWRGPPVA